MRGYNHSMRGRYSLSWIVLASLVALILVLFALDRGKNYNGHASAQDLTRTTEEVKLLFDYTKFHITVYTTIATIIVAAASGVFKERFEPSTHVLWAAVVAVFFAGLAAGVVAASMPQCFDKANFWDWRTGPYNLDMLTIRSWTYVEHTSFWLAAILIVIAFAKGRSVTPKSGS